MPYFKKTDPRLWKDGKVIIGPEKSEHKLMKILFFSKDEKEKDIAGKILTEMSYGMYESYKWIDEKQAKKNNEAYEKRLKEWRKKNGVA